MKLSNWLISILLIVTVSCDKGLAPETDNVEPGFSGTITFTGDWPTDVTGTHLVLFKDPLVSEEDFSQENLVYLSQGIPYGVEQFDYNTLSASFFNNIVPGEYAYLAIAQTTSAIPLPQRELWTVAGVYYSGEDTSQPGTIIIPQNTFVTGININCDFNNPPEQPPGG